MAKNPAFQFYVYDWQTNRKLQRCSARARGVWVELLGLMHDGEPYGYLTIEGDVPDLKETAKLVHLGYQEYKSGYTELLRKGVLKINEDGIPYSSRMIEDERVRQVRRRAGKLGGNPVLLNQKDNQDVKMPPKVEPTPSSSSSSSSSKRYIQAMKRLRKDFPIYRKTTDDYLAGLVAEFPTIDHAAVLGKLHAFESDGGNTKQPSLRIRNWFENEKKYQSDNGHRKQVKTNDLSHIAAGFPGVDQH